MRLPRLSLLAVVFFAAACGERNSVEPDVPNDLRGRAVALDVDLDANTVTQVSTGAMSVSSGAQFALLGHNEVTTTITNVTRSNLPYNSRVRLRFDLALTNNLHGADLVPATFPDPPVGQVVAFPFSTEPSSWWGSRVKATADWNGTGQAGSGQPWNFFNNDRHCITSSPPSDCYRWEAYGEVLPAGATTPARQVGFDVDPSVRQFRVYVVVAADIRERPLPAGTGALVGTVTSPELGALAGVQVSAGGQSATTGSTGLYTISGLAPGAVSVTVSGLPAGCTAPAPMNANIVAEQVTVVSLSVPCAPQAAPERIAVTSIQDGNQELYVLNADGTNPLRLTTTTEAELVPAMSPDARRVAFIQRTGSGSSRRERLLVIDVDGANLLPLTDWVFDALNPTWSPNGQQIAFTCTLLTSTLGDELCIVNADGSNLHSVLDGAGFPFFALYPDWDPTSDRIGHVADFSNPDGFFAFVASNGNGLGGVTTGQDMAIAPAWSPNGNKIAFARFASDGDIYVADAATGTAVPLTSGLGMKNSPTWTRDGSAVVYEQGGNLYRVSVSGGMPVQLTTGGVYFNPHIR